MSKTKRHILVACVFMLFISMMSGCKSQDQTLVISCDYDRKNDLTVFTIAPDGNIEIPGEWKYSGHYIPQTQQHFLRNSDGTLLIIAKMPQEMPQNRKPTESELDHKFNALQSYYKWETDYFINEKGKKVDLIEENKKECFVLYDMDNVLAFICGFKNGFFYNLSIQEGPWTLEKKHLFLKTLYLKN